MHLGRVGIRGPGGLLEGKSASGICCGVERLHPEHRPSSSEGPLCALTQVLDIGGQGWGLCIPRVKMAKALSSPGTQAAPVSEGQREENLKGGL